MLSRIFTKTLNRSREIFPPKRFRRTDIRLCNYRVALLIKKWKNQNSHWPLLQVDVRLKLRTTDVDFWKSELDNKLADIKEEVDEVPFILQGFVCFHSTYFKGSTAVFHSFFLSRPQQQMPTQLFLRKAISTVRLIHKCNGKILLVFFIICINSPWNYDSPHMNVVILGKMINVIIL